MSTYHTYFFLLDKIKVHGLFIDINISKVWYAKFIDSLKQFCYNMKNIKT